MFGLFVSLALAQCGPNGCYVQPVVASVSYQWVTGTVGDEHRVYLYRNGVQIGGYDLTERIYRPFDGVNWGVKCDPPIVPPEANYGVDTAKLHASPVYSVNGVQVSKDAAYQAVEGLTDDSRKLRVTVIGSKEAREPVAKEIAAALPDVAVRDYDPSAWELKPGFVTTGNPTIYAQAPDGKVLHRQDDPADVVSAIRKAKESYDPKKDPDLRKSAIPFGFSINLTWIVLAAAVAAMFYRKYEVSRG